jgi:hypothetical protein
MLSGRVAKFQRHHFIKRLSIPRPVSLLTSVYLNAFVANMQITGISKKSKKDAIFSDFSSVFAFH